MNESQSGRTTHGVKTAESHAVHAADHIIIGPGDLFTSIMPNRIVPGVGEALAKTKARVLYVVNIMTKFGETDGFAGYDFVCKIEECVGRRLDGIIFNTARPGEELLAQYRAEQACFVEFERHAPCWGDRRVHTADLLDTAGGILRHDSEKLAQLIKGIIL